jgi:hypothetical protein
MARTNTYTCRTCGTKYEFCLKCQVSKPDFDAENFCTKDHANIYAILSKHGCNLIFADEALKELAAYNLDDITLAEDVLAHVKRIKSEAKLKVKAPAVDEKAAIEQPVVKATNKNNKKKW